MKVLVIGSGGREHALAWKISRSPLVKALFTAPGNGGTVNVSKNKNLSIQATDTESLLGFALKEKIDLTVVGPEDPLSAGITNIFTKNGLKTFGPSKEAAVLESSKGFAKEFMKNKGIPTPNFKIFDDYDACLKELEKVKPPIVLKANGLAMGKGVEICSTHEEARLKLKSMMVDKSLGKAGTKVVLDHFIKGFELSYIALADGKNILPLATSQDNKRLFDDDKGPNTGGMGAYSPISQIDPKTLDIIRSSVMEKTIHGMSQGKTPFKGALYAGLILENKNPLVLEFNVRFGDPETQPLLFRMKSDIVPLLIASVEGNLKDKSIEWEDEFSLCLVMASGGYPGPYKKGFPIEGPLDINERDESTIVFHAGTKKEADKTYTNGGRVLGICVKHPVPQKAMEKALDIAEQIRFEGAHYRRDIGKKVL